MAITAQTTLATKFGNLIVRFHIFSCGTCLTLSKGDISRGVPFVRLHSACLFGEAFYSQECDCCIQLTEALRLMQQASTGLLIYGFQEGRGIGLEQKIRAMELQRTLGCSSSSAFHHLGYQAADMRTYQVECLALQELHVSRTLILYSNNPSKRRALLRCGYELL